MAELKIIYNEEELARGTALRLAADAALNFDCIKGKKSHKLSLDTAHPEWGMVEIAEKEEFVLTISDIKQWDNK